MKISKELKHLPADFINNTIIVRPNTICATTLNLFTDTGGGLVMTANGVHKANLPLHNEIIDNKEVSTVELPEFIEDHWIPPLLIEGKKGKLIVFDGEHAKAAPYLQEVDGLLGHKWFGNRIWTFDYLKNEMLYHEQLDLSQMDKNHYTQLWFQKDKTDKPSTYFPRIQAAIDGEVLDFLFDTGATLRLSEIGYNTINDNGGKTRGTCFITEKLFKKWMKRHPEWRVIENAEQDTNFPIIEVPELTIAGFSVGPVWFTYRYDTEFHHFMAQWMDKKVEGALGGSLFQYFKITVDYPREVAFFER